MNKYNDINEKSISNYFKSFESKFTDEEKAQVQRIISKLTEVVNYHPRIGVFGKTGSGKSSLCNSLFGHDVCEISDISACTRSPQDVLLQMDQGCSMTLVDVPGIGETQERDEEYAALYSKLLPELDLVLWLIKADDRAFSVDKEIFKNIVRPHLTEGKPFFMVLNQVDKISPHQEWNEAEHCPGENQLVNIEKKRESVCNIFDLPKSRVLSAAATEKYNLTALVEEIVFALPDEKKISFIREVKMEYISPSVKNETASALVRISYGAAIGGKIGAKIGALLGPQGAAVGSAIGTVLGGIAGFFFKW